MNRMHWINGGGVQLSSNPGRHLLASVVPLTIAMMVFGAQTLGQEGSSASATKSTSNMKAKGIVDRYVERVRPLEIAAAEAWWTANTTGSESAFAAKEKAQNELDAALSDPGRFAEIKALRQTTISDPYLRREIDLLYLYHLEKQVDKGLLGQMVSKANTIEKAFNVFRATVGDATLTDSDVRKVLGGSTDGDYRKQVWLASKNVGGTIEQPLRELVKLRNQAAVSLGFKNFQDMTLQLNEQKPDQILALFDELDRLTREPFAAAKKDIDLRLAKRYGITPDELRPWHYHDPFFQEPPAVYDTDLDETFKSVDIQAVCREFYAGIGLPIDDVLAKSDLFEKPGKSPHAFCTDINRDGDVRVLANIIPNHYWMATMLHELGHSVYSSKNISNQLPYLLRADAHILTTEGIAMMFERLCNNSRWLKAMKVPVSDPVAYDAAASRMRRNKLLIFSRWCQVMFRFEKGMYENPDQDLNRLWWDLVEEYQMLKRPDGRSAPDYASKIHIVSAPVYYHNYLLGELFACQVHACIVRDCLGGGTPATTVYWGDPQVGSYLTAKVFALGKTQPWDKMVEACTGEPLSSKAFAAEFADSK